MKKKFIAYSESLGSREVDLLDLASQKECLKDYEIFLQFLGYKDHQKKDVYEGDVLELKITENLMDRKKSLFSSTNLGMAIKNKGNVTSVILINKTDKSFMDCSYELYFCVNGKIQREEDGSFVRESSGADSWFPRFLCENGAVVISNKCIEPSILDNF